MARSPEKNTQIREERRMQILNAALTAYISFGYNGTDMSIIAEKAHLAKGLIYYYYKTKKDLFMALYSWMFEEGYAFSDTLLKNMEEKNPIEQLVAYAYGVFGANNANPRMMQFFIRAPFDTYAIFSPEEWKDVSLKSDMHRKALTKIIERGISQGTITATNPSSAANSFWSVFVANLFEYSKLMSGKQKPQQSETDILKEVVCFCFQGLGVKPETWSFYLEKTILECKETRRDKFEK